MLLLLLLLQLVQLVVELRQARLINNIQMLPCHCDLIITVYCMCALHPPASLLLPSQTAGCPALHLAATDSQNFCHHGFYHWQLGDFSVTCALAYKFYSCTDAALALTLALALMGGWVNEWNSTDNQHCG